MFRILLDLPRSSILNKDLLLHVNPYKTLKNVHTKLALKTCTINTMWDTKIPHLLKYSFSLGRILEYLEI